MLNNYNNKNHIYRLLDKKKNTIELQTNFKINIFFFYNKKFKIHIGNTFFKLKKMQYIFFKKNSKTIKITKQIKSYPFKKIKNHQ